MKKLFYTLFAFAIIVACEKDAFDTDEVNVDSINAVVESNEITTAKAFEFIKNINNTNNLLVSPKSTKGSASTARGGDYGNNWLQVVFFDESATNGQDLAYLRSDTQGEACASNLVNAEEVFYHLPAPDQLVIEIVGGTTTPFTVPSGSYDATFRDDGPPVLIVMDPTRTSAAAGIAPPVANYDFSCAPAAVDTDVIATGTGITLTFDNVNRYDGTIEEGTVGSVVISGGFAAGTGYYDAQGAQISSTIDLATLPVGPNNFIFRSRVNGQGSSRTAYVNITVTAPVVTAPVSSFYTVSCAPFPLTGVLATINDGVTLPNGATSFNYAGTTEQAVRQAIERDILDDITYVSTTALTNPCQ